MFSTSTPILKILAALVWYIGVVILLMKSTGLLLDAYRGGASQFWLVIAILSSLAIGVVKAKYLFIRVCNSNLQRIDNLKKPMLWQFYRGRFFVFLGLMISLGAYLYKLVQGDNLMMIILAVVELSVAIALLLSSIRFWQGRNDES